MLNKKLKACNYHIGIYMWINKITNKVYIGSSVDLESRLRSHFLGEKSNKSLQKDILKYGIINFMVSILEFIEYNDNIEELKKYLIEREQFYLDTICKANEPTKEFYKLSYNKNRKADSRLGCTASDETKLKLSDMRRGKPLSEYHKEQIKLNHPTKNPNYIHHTLINGISEKQKQAWKEVSFANKIPILQYSSEGLFVKEWSSIAEATKELNLPSGNISKNISGITKRCSSYIFKKKISENYPLDLEIVNTNCIQVFDKNLNLLGEYDSIIAINRELPISRQTITKALYSESGISNNYIFKYKYK